MCKISVIIPVYNAEKYIEKTLEFISSQTLKDIEIICVDDGSNDKSALLIKKHQVNDSRIKYYFQQNSGAGQARNLGIKKSNGAYIAFMDADDAYPNNYVLEQLYNTASNNEAIICGGSAVFENSDINDEKRNFFVKGFVSFEDYQFDYLFQRFIFKRIFVIDNQIYFPNYRVYEDPVFLVNAMVKATKFYAINTDVYLYTGAHQSMNMNIDKTKDFLKALIEELQITAHYNLPNLHKLTFERLENEACFYAEKYLYEGDKEIFNLVLQANNAVDKGLINLDSDYIIRSISDLWKAGQKYMKIRNSKIVRFLSKIRN